MNPLSDQVGSPPPNGKLPQVAIIGLFLAVTFVLHFAAARHFLLYEDDYFHIGLPATHSSEWTCRQIVFAWTHWPQGRPAMFSMLALQGAMVQVTGSLWAGYLPALLIITANGYLLFRLLAARFAQTVALGAALLAILSCADPHKILLTHAPLQFAITLNLAGLILYLRGRYLDAYLVAGLSLFFYEISFAVFATAELFYQLRGRFQLKRLAWSFSGWLGIAATVLAIRLFSGESRAIEATGNLVQLAQRVITNVVWGPLYALENSYLHPLLLIARKPSFPLVLASVLLVGFALFALRLIGRSTQPENRAEERINPWIATGIICILLFGPYAMQFGRTVFSGFARPVTGYHLVAGIALGFGGALLLSLRLFGNKPWLTGGAIALLGIVSSYQNLVIQRDYVNSARYQTHFWSEVRRLASDAVPGNVIVVKQEQLQESGYVKSNSWGVSHGWIVLFQQSGPLLDWFSIPPLRPVTVFLIPSDWTLRLETAPDHHFFRTSEYTPPGFKVGQIPFVNKEFIVLEANGAEAFQRNSDQIILSDGPLMPKPIPAASPGDLELTGLGNRYFSPDKP